MPPRSQHAELSRFVLKLQKPFAGFSLLFPGSRGKMLRSISQFEQILLELQENQESLDIIHETATALVKNVKVTNRIMTNIQEATTDYHTRIEQMDEGIQRRLDEARSLHQDAMKLGEREKRLDERETQADQLLANNTRKASEVSNLEHSVKAKLDETISLMKEAQSIENNVSSQQVTLADAMTALQERREKMEQFKLHLQSREEAVTKSMNQLADLAQRKKQMQAELETLRKRTQEEMDRGDELLRERELAVSGREEEVGSMGMLLMERERALHERQKELETREAKVETESKSLGRIRDDLVAKERHIADLQATVESLETQRAELNKAIAGLSARL